MYIRSNSWGAANISWSVVIEELLYAAERAGHETVFVSTNGYKNTKYWSEERALKQGLLQRELLRANTPFDLDITYTVPQNFPDRFLSNSKCKMAIYNYESSIMPANWSKYYSFVDYVLPSSEYVAKMFRKNNCPVEKIKVVPHGIDLGLFNPNIVPLKINTDKKFKFLCVAEPHVRKQIDKLLDLYCRIFSATDDVCLVLKTKIFDDESLKTAKEFEVDLRPVFKKLKLKYGKNMPEIKCISNRLNNIGSLYTACDAFVLMTASEGWGMPFLEALACGLPTIAPRHGGQLEFLNDDNAILTNCGTRRALVTEQYWGSHPQATVGNPDEKHFSEQMRYVYENHTAIKSRLLPAMIKTASKFTWTNVFNQIAELAQSIR